MLLSGVFLSSGLLFLFLVLMIRLGDNCVFVNFGFLSYIFVAFMKSLMRWIMFLCGRSDGFIDVFWNISYLSLEKWMHSSSI